MDIAFVAVKVSLAVVGVAIVVVVVGVVVAVFAKFLPLCRWLAVVKAVSLDHTFALFSFFRFLLLAMALIVNRCEGRARA